MELALEFIVVFVASAGFLVTTRHALFAFAYLVVLAALLVRRRQTALRRAAGPRPSFRDSTSFFDRERALRDIAHHTGYLMVAVAMLVAVGGQIALSLFVQPEVERGRSPEGQVEVTASLTLGGLRLGHVRGVVPAEPGAAGKCTRYRLPLVRASGGLETRGKPGEQATVLQWQFGFGMPPARSWSGVEPIVIEEEAARALRRRPAAAPPPPSVPPDTSAAPGQ